MDKILQRVAFIFEKKKQERFRISLLEPFQVDRTQDKLLMMTKLYEMKISQLLFASQVSVFILNAVILMKSIICTSRSPSYYLPTKEQIMLWKLFYARLAEITCRLFCSLFGSVPDYRFSNHLSLLPRALAPSNEVPAPSRSWKPQDHHMLSFKVQVIVNCFTIMNPIGHFVFF